MIACKDEKNYKNEINEIIKKYPKNSISKLKITNHKSINTGIDDHMAILQIVDEMTYRRFKRNYIKLFRDHSDRKKVCLDLDSTSTPQEIEDAYFNASDESIERFFDNEIKFSSDLSDLLEHFIIFPDKGVYTEFFKKNPRFQINLVDYLFETYEGSKMEYTPVKK